MHSKQQGTINSRQQVCIVNSKEHSKQQGAINSRLQTASVHIELHEQSAANIMWVKWTSAENMEADYCCIVTKEELNIAISKQDRIQSATQDRMQDAKTIDV